MVRTDARLAVAEALGREALVKRAHQRVDPLKSSRELRRQNHPVDAVEHLHVEYAEGRMTYGILFIFSPCYEYSNVECVHVPVQYTVLQAEYVVRIRVAASQEYVNGYEHGNDFVFYRVVEKDSLIASLRQ